MLNDFKWCLLIAIAMSNVNLLCVKNLPNHLLRTTVRDSDDGRQRDNVVDGGCRDRDRDQGEKTLEMILLRI